MVISVASYVQVLTQLLYRNAANLLQVSKIISGLLHPDPKLRLTAIEAARMLDGFNAATAQGDADEHIDKRTKT